MVKKISVFITILGLFFVGVPQFNVKADTIVIKDGVDYRTLETGTPLQYGNMELSPITANSVANGLNFGNWKAYMENNNLDRVEIYLPNVTTLYFYDGSNEVINSVADVSKIVLDNSDWSYFLLSLYKSDGGALMYDEILQEEGWNWFIPETTLMLIDINSGGGDDANAYFDGYNDGYAIGYNDGLDETDASGIGGLLSSVFIGLGSLLAIEILPNIQIGAIIAVPLVFGVIFFILGKRKGD